MDSGFIFIQIIKIPTQLDKIISFVATFIDMNLTKASMVTERETVAQVKDQSRHLLSVVVRQLL